MNTCVGYFRLCEVIWLWGYFSFYVYIFIFLLYNFLGTTINSSSTRCCSSPLCLLKKWMRFSHCKRQSNVAHFFLPLSGAKTPREIGTAPRSSSTNDVKPGKQTLTRKLRHCSSNVLTVKVSKVLTKFSAPKYLSVFRRTQKPCGYTFTSKMPLLESSFVSEQKVNHLLHDLNQYVC